MKVSCVIGDDHNYGEGNTSIIAIFKDVADADYVVQRLDDLLAPFETSGGNLEIPDEHLDKLQTALEEVLEGAGQFDLADVCYYVNTYDVTPKKSRHV